MWQTTTQCSTARTWGCTAELTWLVRTLVLSTVQSARYILITTKKKNKIFIAFITLSYPNPIWQVFHETWSKLKFRNMSSTSTSEATEAANTLDRRSSQASSNGDAASLDDYIVKGNWHLYYLAHRIHQPIPNLSIRLFCFYFARNNQSDRLKIQYLQFQNWLLDPLNRIDNCKKNCFTYISTTHIAPH